MPSYDKTKISSHTVAALILSLVLFSLFPFYITFILKLPPEPSVIITDCLYALMVVGSVSVFMGWYRPKWLIVVLLSFGVINAIGLLWLYTALSNLSPSL